ncbi:RNA 2'-phosphotransferase Tpt1 / KptA family [Zea mays]|uniref:2'-phosphotransferase n=1 Tax=Zea mays TaxID=4577 RepID=A0A1D6NVZ1_MAIZE|nr:RNA 2'-phosphotransferase Tpt1 / KptA family [Zea mays]
MISDPVGRTRRVTYFANFLVTRPNCSLQPKPYLRAEPPRLIPFPVSAPHTHRAARRLRLMRAVAAAASPPLRALLLLSRHPRRAGFTNWPSLPRGQNAGPTAPPAATAPKPAAPSRRQGRGLTASLPRQVARISTPHLRPPATPPRCPDRRHQSHGVRALAGCPRKTVRHLPAPTSHLRFTMNPSSSSSSSGGYHSRAAAFASPQPRGGGGRRRGGGRGQDGSDRIDALGRLLTRVLRHMAAELRLDMRTDGYVRVRDLLKLNLQTFAKVPLKSHTVDEIRETVTSESLLKPILSPDEVSVCVHGTYRKNLDSILQSGLKRMARLHVHFSSGLPSDGEVISGMLSFFRDTSVFRLCLIALEIIVRGKISWRHPNTLANSSAISYFL